MHGLDLAIHQFIFLDSVKDECIIALDNNNMRSMDGVSYSKIALGSFQPSHARQRSTQNQFYGDQPSRRFANRHI